MKRVSIAYGVLASLGVVGYAAADDAMSRLSKARSLKCDFGPGRHAEWREGLLVVGSGRFGPPGPQSTIHYDSINASTRKARVIGAVGASDLEVFADASGVTLVERVPHGGLAITTVYGSYDKKQAFPAVLSKHVNVLGPFPQQYYGSCVAWE